MAKNGQKIQENAVDPVYMNFRPRRNWFWPCTNGFDNLQMDFFDPVQMDFDPVQIDFDLVQMDFDAVQMDFNPI